VWSQSLAYCANVFSEVFSFGDFRFAKSSFAIAAPANPVKPISMYTNVMCISDLFVTPFALRVPIY
ncbi:MAG: hypothetical protein MUQ60_04620, partial [Porticoccaceae bacterium]|nr:hypothetical protein [Porticoccaceae bacterium]